MYNRICHAFLSARRAAVYCYNVTKKVVHRVYIKKRSKGGDHFLNKVVKKIIIMITSVFLSLKDDCSAVAPRFSLLSLLVEESAFVEKFYVFSN